MLLKINFYPPHKDITQLFSWNKCTKNSNWFFFLLLFPYWQVYSEQLVAELGAQGTHGGSAKFSDAVSQSAAPPPVWL